MQRGPLGIQALLALPQVVQETTSANVGAFPVPLGAPAPQSPRRKPEPLPEVEYAMPDAYRALCGM